MASLPTLSASLPRPHVRLMFRTPAPSWGCFTDHNGRCGGSLDTRLRLRWRSPVRAKVGEADKDKGAADSGLRVDQQRKTLRRRLRLRLRPRLRVLRWRLRRLLSPRELAGDAAAALRRAARRVPLPAAASVVLGALLLAARLTVPKNAAREVAYSDLLAGLRAGAVTAAAFEEDSRRIYFSKAEEDVGSGGDDEREAGGGGAAGATKWAYYARRVPHDEGFLLGLMRDGGVDYRSAPRPAGRLLVDMLTTLLTLWFSLLPMMWFIQRQMSAAGSADKRRKPRKQRVGFEDVQGVDEAKEELVEIVSCLRGSLNYKKLGARLPRGVLLAGPPGTGKTLLAKAVAGEAGIPFFSVSASEFVEMFVGRGAARVRDLFKEAKEAAPSIIFIDELDAVGGSRGRSFNDERDQTLNQLLTEMDGFDSDVKVIVMAATNRPKALDSALCRPGRFSRKVFVGVPDLEGRRKILAVHFREVPLEEDSETICDLIANLTPGLVGADLANIVNEAALLRDRLFAALGRVYTQEEFEKLCFDFGIELDDVTTEKAIIRKEKHLDEDGEADGDEEVIYKIEVAANRYDLLCLEGIARSLRIFIGTEATPVFKLSSIPNGSMLQMHVKKETSQIRPYIVCAVLRGVTFDEVRYNSFIDLQDKLHQNICRKRTLVAIGTHDLDTLQGPFSYEALPPQEINFVPLKQERHFTADKLMDFYKSDMKLKKFLHIIENSPEFPVIYDSNRTVLSLPPIINGAHSAITLKTRNVFIECTATDLTKANIVLNTMVAMFSEYCENKFEVEPVEVISYDGSKAIYPDLSCYKMEASISEILGRIGISLDETQVISLLNKMQLQAEPCPSKGEPRISVSVPPTRSDVLHACDLAEDVAIAYGYNNVPKSKPKSMTIGGRQPLNRFSDKIRAEVTRAGYMEVLTFVLTSYEENFDMINRKDDGNKAVIIANPRTSEFEVVRTSLMSCLLKTLKHNIDHPRPIKIFEVGDVVVLDTSRDVGASNNRRLAALYCSSNSGFEEIMGLVDRIVKIVRAPHITFSHPYYVETNEPEFFTKRQCKIVTSDGKQVGYLGIVHAEVLRKFGIPDPCTFVEMDLEALL